MCMRGFERPLDGQGRGSFQSFPSLHVWEPLSYYTVHLVPCYILSSKVVEGLFRQLNIFSRRRGGWTYWELIQTLRFRFFYRMSNCLWINNLSCSQASTKTFLIQTAATLIYVSFVLGHFHDRLQMKTWVNKVGINLYCSLDCHDIKVSTLHRRL